jgi:predicted RNA-binding Zn-ribbon protein involved in translation (DUF1610 family)
MEDPTTASRVFGSAQSLAAESPVVCMVPVVRTVPAYVLDCPECGVEIHVQLPASLKHFQCGACEAVIIVQEQDA